MLNTDAHIFSGMQRDMSVSKQKPEFLWDAHNIRLTAREKDTMLSITNEKGTSQIKDVAFNGTYLGHCVMGNYLIVFTTNPGEVKVVGTQIQQVPDKIYKVNKGNGYSTEILFEGELNFDAAYPIETLGIYENELVQKVYWVDGHNQPRLINIVKNNANYNSSSFDFVRDLKLKESVKVVRQGAAGGQFQSGVIQYALTYYDKYGQESNIVYVTPLHYITFNDRGGSPEEKVGVSFRIDLSGLDSNFEYARLYSIYRSSLNGTPVVKRLTDIPVTTDVTVANNGGGDATTALYYRTSGTVTITAKTNNGTKYDKRYISAFSSYLRDVPELSGKFFYFKKSDFKSFQINVDDKILTWGNNEEFYISQGSSVNGPGDTNKRLIHGGLGSGNYFLIGTNITYGTAIVGASFIDDGTQGEVVDPTSLLYVGGETVSASTLTQKDGTLFLGNLKILRPPISSLNNISIEHNNDAKAYAGVSEDSTREVTLSGNGSSAYYDYKSVMTAIKDGYSANPAGFKKGERYRFGVQLQYKSGKWSDPIWLKDADISNSPKLEGTKLTIPTYKIMVNLTNVPEGYIRARGVAVFPSISERTVVAQGIVTPTVFNLASRNSGIPYAQSSWFFRPTPNDALSDSTNDGSSALKGSVLEYRHNYLLPSAGDRGAEIQGIPEFQVGKVVSSGTNVSIPAKEKDRSDLNINISWSDATSLFAVDRQIVTFHSPDVEFDDSIESLDLSGLKSRGVGRVVFTANMGDISLQTSSPTIHPDGSGFVHRSVKDYDASGTARALAAGLFYSDYLVDDAGGKYQWYDPQKHYFLFMVYPWHKSGSLNNDTSRPADKGARSSVLSQKKMSNLRFSNNTTWEADSISTNYTQLFSSDQVTMIKLGSSDSYYGNVDTLLSPINAYSVIFDNGGVHDKTGKNGTPSFTRHKYAMCHFTRRGAEDYRGRMWHRNGSTSFSDSYTSLTDDTGDDNGTLATSREGIRMKYKSTKHLVLSLSSSLSTSKAGLFMVELYRERSSKLEDDTIFGGFTDEAKKFNTWVPVGEPVEINRSGNTTINYEYGDTWYQRYDCLKTYPFTLEDENSITEIASFLVECRMNIDGRYDRNRGQASNLVTTPVNFNLFNPVYTQLNNFFSYRILDSDYYKLDNYQNSVTWSLNKEAAATVDSWAKVTLANILDFDGNMGAVTALTTVNDGIYCFQESGLSQILFNSRVQIPTSDSVPIEIGNSYKVDGNRYISDSIGTKNKWSIVKANSGLYFVDSTGSTLYHLGNGLTDVSGTHGFSHWFDTLETSKPWTSLEYTLKTFYDKNRNDVYITSGETSLVFSEVLGQFTSFMSYEAVPAMFNIGPDFYAIKDGSLWQLFTGDYNHFFDRYEPFDFTFVSNKDSVQDKVFSNIELRTDFFEGDSLQHRRIFDYIRVWNEYQDTGDVTLTFRNAKPSNLKKKFRIWGIDIPRDKDRKLDRIRNTWAYVKLGVYGDLDHETSTRMELHDLSVKYFS